MKSRSRSQIIIFTALAIALIGRGWGLWHRGLMEHDEGHALLNANTWWHVMRWVLSGGLWGGDAGSSITQLRDTLHQQGGTLYSAGKLGYSLLVATVGLPFHITTGLAMILAWVAGLLVAALSGVLAWQYSRSRLAAVIAAAGCLTSPLLMELSREASGTIWALVFGLAGAVVINKSVVSERTGRCWVLGLVGGGLLGYGFACHFNLAPFILAVYLAGAAYAWPVCRQLKQVGSGASLVIRRLLPAAFGGLGMLALFEAGTQTADYVLRDSYPDFLPFSGELHRLFFRDQAPMLKGILYGDGAIGWGAEAWAIYGHALLREGPAWLLLMGGLVGLFVLGRRRYGDGRGRTGELPGRTRRRDSAATMGNAGSAFRLVPAVLLLVVPALFWAAYIYRVERSLGMCMAASWILLGIVLGPVLEHRPSGGVRRIAIEILAVMQFAACAIACVHLAELKSPLPIVVAETFAAPETQGKQVTAGSFDVGFAPLWKWAIVQYERKPGATNVEVDFARFDGAQIVFVDPSTWNRPNPDFNVTRKQAESGRVIIAEMSAAPPWTVWSVLLD